MHLIGRRALISESYYIFGLSPVPPETNLDTPLKTEKDEDTGKNVDITRTTCRRIQLSLYDLTDGVTHAPWFVRFPRSPLE